MKIIKWIDSTVLYESEKKTIEETVIEAIERDVDLGDADLRGANLGGANLGGANLRGADLRGANLGGAEFFHVRFYGKTGKTKIKKSQVESFFMALGIVIEE